MIKQKRYFLSLVIRPKSLNCLFPYIPIRVTSHDPHDVLNNMQLYGKRFHVMSSSCWHDDVIKWKHFPRYWPFVRGIHRSQVNSPHKGQWRGALMFSLICTRINGWVNNGEAGDLRRRRAHYDVTVMIYEIFGRGLMIWRPFIMAEHICEISHLGFHGTDFENYSLVV